MRSSYDFDLFSGLTGNTQTNLAELISALLGYTFIDNLGRAFLIDNFSQGLLGWQAIAVGGAKYPFVYGGHFDAVSMSYATSYKIGLDGGVINNEYAAITKSYFLGTQKRLGIEAGVELGNQTPNYRISIDYNREGSGAKFAVMIINAVTGDISVMTGAGFVTVYNFGGVPPGNVFTMPIKLVGDWETQKYVRLFVGEKRIDVSNIVMGNSGSSVAGRAIHNIAGVSFGAGSVTGYVNYARFTKDEP